MKPGVTTYSQGLEVHYIGSGENTDVGAQEKSGLFSIH